jgi:capsular polysaccharide biosynthesis protein
VAVLVLVVAGAVAGGWLATQRPQDHEARASVLVAPLLGNPFSPEAGGDDLVNLTTEAELVTSDAVGKLVSDRLPGKPSVAGVLAGVSVKVPANTQVLVITVRQPSKAEALRRAQEFATTFLAYRQARMQSAVFDRSARVKELITQRSAEMRADVQKLGTLPSSSAQLIPLRQQVLDLTSQISDLRTQLAGLESASRDPGQVVTPAAAHASLLDNPQTLGVAGGAAVGLVLALLAGGVRRRVDDRVRDPQELDALDVPVLGVTDTGDPVGCRRVRTALLTAVPKRPMVVSVVRVGTSPRPLGYVGELAGSLGSAGFEVIVVDAAGDAADQVPAAAGLSELIRYPDPGAVDDALSGEGGFVGRLGPGNASGLLDDLIDSPGTELLLQELRKRADVVLIVAGAAGSVRARSLARLADASVMEVVEGRSGLGEIRDAVATIEQSGGRVVGAIYLRPTVRHGGAATGRTSS